MGTNFYDLSLERDRLEFSLGDTLDVKAGIVLAVITVLGTLSGTLLSATSIPKWEQVVQLACVGCLAFACFCAVSAVVPRKYMMPPIPQSLRSWQASLQEYYAKNPDPSAHIDSVVAESTIALAAERIEINRAINSRKSRWIEIAIWPVVVALVLDMATLATVGLLKALS